MSITIGVNAIVTKNNKILLIKRADTKIWALPGGNVEKDETFEDAVGREVKEETNISVLPKKQTGVYVRTIPFFEDIVFAYKCNCRNFNTKTSKESVEVKWVEINNALKITPKFVQTIIKDSLENTNKVQVRQLTKYEISLIFKFLLNKIKQ